MKNKSAKELCVFFIYFFIGTILVRSIGDMSWRISIGVVCIGSYIWIIHDELDSLKRMFFIADQELVRVSQLAGDLQDEVYDLQSELSKLRDTHLYGDS